MVAAAPQQLWSANLLYKNFFYFCHVTAPPLPQNDGSLLQLSLKRRAGIGFGLSVQGGRDTDIPEICIKRVFAGSPAHELGTLTPGDILLRVNGHNLVGVTHEEAITIFKKCGSTLDIVLRKRPGPCLAADAKPAAEPGPVAPDHAYANLPAVVPPLPTASVAHPYVNLVPAEPPPPPPIQAALCAPSLKSKAAPLPPVEAPPRRQARDPLSAPAAVHPFVYHIDRKVSLCLPVTCVPWSSKREPRQEKEKAHKVANTNAHRGEEEACLRAQAEIVFFLGHFLVVFNVVGGRHCAAR